MHDSFYSLIKNKPLQSWKIVLRKRLLETFNLLRFTKPPSITWAPFVKKSFSYFIWVRIQDIMYRHVLYI